jgi:hypothetical protein
VLMAYMTRSMSFLMQHGYEKFLPGANGGGGGPRPGWPQWIRHRNPMNLFWTTNGRNREIGHDGRKTSHIFGRNADENV